MNGKMEGREERMIKERWKGGRGVDGWLEREGRIKEEEATSTHFHCVLPLALGQSEKNDKCFKCMTALLKKTKITI